MNFTCHTCYTPVTLIKEKVNINSMKRFDLFKLHSKKDRPNGWIWVQFDPKILKDNYLKLLKRERQSDIAKKINRNLKCGLSTIQKHLIKLKNSEKLTELPLPIIIETVKIIDIGLKNKILTSFRYFKCKNYNAQKTAIVKNINSKLSKILGAHMADGYLGKENDTYRIKVCDGKEDNIEKFSEWIEKTFHIKTKKEYSKKDNMWICWFNNKIIGRYFEKIFDIKPGKKSDIAKEPEIIKNSSLKIRKAFAKGVLMFDGGVKSNGMIALTSMSKQLIENVEKILKLDEIKVTKNYNPKKKSWLIESRSGRDKEYLKKWLYYFEEGTWKHERLKFFIEEKKYNLNELNYLFPKYHRSKIQLNDVYLSVKKIKKGKIKDIMVGLNKFKISPVTAYKYLFLLEKSGLIYKEREKHVTPKNGYFETIYHLN